MRNASRKITGLAAVTVVFFLLLASGFLKPLTDPLMTGLLRLAAPAYAAGNALRSALEGPAADDPVALARTVDELRVENAKLRTLLAENESLKTALDFRERQNDAMVLARIVSETSDDVFHGLIIDRGADDGVEAGQPVVVGDGVIIGKVFDVRARTASVMLLSDSKSRLAVAAQNVDGTIGVLEGDRGLSMAITLIPQSEKLAPGDSVITSGIEPGIRRGLAVGVIEKVNRGTQDPFQSADVAPFRSLSHPVFVQVLISSEL